MTTKTQRQQEVEAPPPKQFKPKCILIEPPPGETLHIGYVGGVRMPKKKSKTGN